MPTFWQPIGELLLYFETVIHFAPYASNFLHQFNGYLRDVFRIES
jgi:hypothetical protein